MKNITLGLFCASLFLVTAVPAKASIKISLNPANLSPVGSPLTSANQVDFVSGLVDPSGGNSGFLGTIYTAGGVLLESWETFCVESGGHVEYINFGTNYRIDSTTSTNATMTNNFVTDAAKWIYYQFGHGGLTGWVDDDGEEVQEAIWSQVEGGGSGGTPLTTADGKAAGWVADAIAALTNADLGIRAQALAEASRIRILNPVTIDANGNVIISNQSMLYEVVPEASTIVVWSLLSTVGGLAYLRRRNGVTN